MEDTINNAREGVLGSIEKTTGYDVNEVINYNQTLGGMAKVDVNEVINYNQTLGGMAKAKDALNKFL